MKEYEKIKFSKIEIDDYFFVGSLEESFVLYSKRDKNSGKAIFQSTNGIANKTSANFVCEFSNDQMVFAF